MGMNRRLMLRAVTDTTASPDKRPLSPTVLSRQNRAFIGTGGISKENAGRGFLPAFMDRTTRIVYLSRFANGAVAPLHLLDGLPEELVAERSAAGCVTAAKSCVIAGFIRDGLFYTREQAASAVAFPAVTQTERA